MNNKNFLLIILPIVNTTLGLILNFKHSLMGSPSIKNLIVTLVYLAIWVLVFSICTKTRNHIIMKFYAVFWIFTLSLAIITVYINLTEITVNAVLPLVILFLTQWAGIDYLVDNYLISFVLVSFISLTMSFTSVHFIRKWKQV